MLSDQAGSTQYDGQRPWQAAPSAATFALRPDERRAYDAIVKEYQVVNVPDYFLETWVPLMDAAEAWLVLAFRQLAFVARSQRPTGVNTARVTLRDLAKWSGVTFQHVAKVMQRARYLHWFVTRADGLALGEHSGKRSQVPTYLVRIEVPLTPLDQARLQGFLLENAPHDDEGWLQVLHRAPSAKSAEIDPACALPTSPKPIDDMVREMRNPGEGFPPELELACVELHQRWVTTNFTGVRHYFIKTWLPDLTPALGMLIVVARKRAQKGNQEPVGEFRASGWESLARAVGVAPFTVKRWLCEPGKYPLTRFFFPSLREEVRLTGVIEDIDGDDWLVCGKRVKVTSQTAVRDPVVVEDYVRLHAHTGAGEGDGQLIARSIEIADRSHPRPAVVQSGLFLDVSISEPIHPMDTDRFEKVRQSLDQARSASPTEGDSSITISDKPVPLRDNRGAKDDKQATEDDNSGAESDKDVTRDDKPRTESDASRDLRLPNSLSQHESQQPQQVAAVDLFTSWQMERILNEAGISASDAAMIRRGGARTWRDFAAWLLWSLTTRTIDAPVLHAVSRVRKGETPPASLRSLVQSPLAELWQWMAHDVENVPWSFQEPVQGLREQGAAEKLLRPGFSPPSAPEELVSQREEESVPWNSEVAQDEGDPARVTSLIRGQSAAQVWKAACDMLQRQMPRSAFDTWLREAKLLACRDGIFEIGLQNAYGRDWLEDRLQTTLERILMGLSGQEAKVRFVVHDPVAQGVG